MLPGIGKQYQAKILYIQRRPPLNFPSAPCLDFSWCSLNLCLKLIISTFTPRSAANSIVNSIENPNVSYSLNASSPLNNLSFCIKAKYRSAFLKPESRVLPNKQDSFSTYSKIKLWFSSSSLYTSLYC